LCEPEFELWVLRWLEAVVMAQTRNEVSCHHLRRVIDVAAFYDLTTFHFPLSTFSATEGSGWICAPNA
jgi:hypothetical protein